MTINTDFVLLDKKTVTKIRKYLKDVVSADSLLPDTPARRHTQQLYNALQSKQLRLLPIEAYVVEVTIYYKEGEAMELESAILFTHVDVFNYLQDKAEELVRDNTDLGHFTIEPFSTYEEESFNVDTVTAKVNDKDKSRIIRHLDKDDSFKVIDFYTVGYKERLISIELQKAPLYI